MPTLAEFVDEYIAQHEASPVTLKKLRFFTFPKTEASRRAVPLQTTALAALDQLPDATPTDLLFPAERGGYLDLHNFRNRDWKPAPLVAPLP